MKTTKLTRISTRTFTALALTLAFAASFATAAHAQVDKKKVAAPAPKAAPARPAARPSAPAARPSGPSAAHGPTTSAPAASHGPTTAAPHAGAPTTAGRPGAPEHAAAPGGRPGGVPSPAMHGPMGHPAPAGGRDMRAPNGSAVRMRPGGHPSDFHDARRGMDIHHNLAGGRRGMIERPDHSRVFFERGRPGYINHPYMFHGHEFGRRTYYWHGRAYDRFYRPYGFHGIGLEVYAPVRFYPIGFYGWAYHPWGAPIHYGWGWNAAPWYGYYGRAYFEPYPVYAGPNYWLTDYLISQSLQAQYEAQIAAGTPPPPLADATPLTPEVKQQIADEVQRQLALESAEAQQNAQGQEPDPASSGIARMLSDGQPHVFVAGDEVDVTDASGQECAVTEGDVLQLANQPGPNDTSAQLIVVASKGGPDCHKRAIVNVAFDDLQNMQNHMRETVDRGLEDLQAKQGTDGLPPAPPSAKAPPTTTEFAQLAPPPDPSGAADIDAAAGQADQSEKEVLAAAGGDSSATDGGTQAPAPVVSIALGQSIDQVQTSLGQPTRVVNLGPKAIYFYKDMKVTFVNGKVTNIE